MTVVLETERLFLRELLLNDVEPLTAVLANRDVARYLDERFAPGRVRAVIQEQHESYEAHGYGLWAVVHRESAAFIGQAGIREARLGPELACTIDALYWGHGLGREVAAAVIAHAFGALSLDHVTASIHKKNKPARKLAESLGMALLEKGDTFRYEIRRESS